MTTEPSAGATVDRERGTERRIDVAAAVRRHAAYLESAGAAVCSPIGTWLLLAHAAPAAIGTQQQVELETALGTDCHTAHRTARKLMASLPAPVSAALAAWSSPRLDAVDAVTAVLDGFVGADRGPIPTQAQADAWAARHTEGIIDQFPLTVRPTTLLVLATAVATKVSWPRPYGVRTADRLVRGPAAGFQRVARWLYDGDSVGTTVLVDTGDGPVAAHLARSADGLIVASVIGDPAVPRAAVLAHAHDIASRAAAGALTALSWWDVPEGPGAAWIVETIQASQHEYGLATLPAWKANADIDLLAATGVGFGPAVAVLADIIETALPEAAPVDVEAKQSAAAAYTRTGFEAAAVTATAIHAASAAVPVRRPCRVGHVEFSHPYAVVAVCEDRRSDDWTGVPLFSAWVTTGTDAD